MSKKWELSIKMVTDPSTWKRHQLIISTPITSCLTNGQTRSTMQPCSLREYLGCKLSMPRTYSITMVPPTPKSTLRHTILLHPSITAVHFIFMGYLGSKLSSSIWLLRLRTLNFTRNQTRTYLNSTSLVLKGYLCPPQK